MTRGIAYKRAQSKRIKRAHQPRWSLHPTAALLGRFGRTPKPCSCWMCGNPRRHCGEPTLHERSSAELFKKIDYPDL